MASADCSPALTGKLSPGKVLILSPRALRLYLVRRDDLWASLLLASLPPHPASLPVRVPTVESLSSAAFGLASRLHLAVDYGYRPQFRQAPFILIESAHAGHTSPGREPWVEK